MTPHRAGDKKGLRGSYILDRKTRVGRIVRASGTRHLPTFRRINEMITTLNETGRDDILRALREGELSPLSVYGAFRTNELHRLPTRVELKPLKESLDAWLDQVECSASQKAAHKTMINKVTAPGAGTVADLSARLALVRLDCKKARTPAQFNRVKMSALSFVRDTLKRSHRLYGELQDVPPMKEKKAPLRQPQTFAQLVAHAEKLTDQRDRNALWAMALTGMGGKEYYIDGWEVESDRVKIFGIKREKRSRIVPRVLSRYYMVAAPSATVGRVREKRRFGERLFALCGIHTYDLRRSYANILEAAGVPRTRRKLYMGHAGGDVTSLYEQHEVDQFLGEDTRKIEAHLAQTPITSHITLSRKNLKRGGVSR